MKDKRTIQKTCYFGFPVMLAIEQYMKENNISNFNIGLNRFLQEAFSKESSFEQVIKKIDDLKEWLSDKVE
ncbi:hypothetical protein [Burkholderia gladioli]|uniref:hypothetical protein n=1 Tax=Burkholderia gladioli TaxID=28095 RepID=UPI001640C682|nr:hypothetical protein [Burkholderia gladioli]